MLYNSNSDRRSSAVLNCRSVLWQVQLSMLAVVLRTTYPHICTAQHLSRAPFAGAVRVFVNAADEFSAAVLPLSTGRKPLQTQCRQLHLFVYVRPNSVYTCAMQSYCVHSIGYCHGREQQLEARHQQRLTREHVSQLFVGLMAPIVLSYFLERWQYGSFVKQLRSEQVSSISRSVRAQAASAASARASLEHPSGANRSQMAALASANAIMHSTEGDSGSAPMLADMLLLGAILPLMWAAGWQLLGLCFRT